MAAASAWYDRSAMGDLLGADFALAAKDTLYRTLDRLLVHKKDLFGFLQGRWEDLFGVRFEVLLYDLTSTYFESDPPSGRGRSAGTAIAGITGATACRW